jgi:hypothetical protein
MPKRTEYTFRFHCPTCGAITTVKCLKCGADDGLDPIIAPDQKWIIKPIHFTEREWEALTTRANAMRGVSGPSELLELEIARFLARPSHRLRRRNTPTERR